MKEKAVLNWESQPALSFMLHPEEECRFRLTGRGACTFEFFKAGRPTSAMILDGRGVSVMRIARRRRRQTFHERYNISGSHERE